MRLKAIAFTQTLETNNRMLASQRNSFSRLVRNQNLARRLIFHLQQTLAKKSLEEGEELLLARGCINIILRRESIDQISDPFWRLNRVPNLTRDVRDTIVVPGGNADHDEVLIRFGSDYLRVALNDRIQRQHGRRFRGGRRPNNICRSGGQEWRSRAPVWGFERSALSRLHPSRHGPRTSS